MPRPAPGSPKGESPRNEWSQAFSRRRPVCDWLRCAATRSRHSARGDLSPAEIECRAPAPSGRSRRRLGPLPVITLHQRHVRFWLYLPSSSLSAPGPIPEFRCHRSDIRLWRNGADFLHLARVGFLAAAVTRSITETGREADVAERAIERQVWIKGSHQHGRPEFSRRPRLSLCAADRIQRMTASRRAGPASRRLI